MGVYEAKGIGGYARRYLRYGSCDSSCDFGFGDGGGIGDHGQEGLREGGLQASHLVFGEDGQELLSAEKRRLIVKRGVGVSVERQGRQHSQLARVVEAFVHVQDRGLARAGSGVFHTEGNVSQHGTVIEQVRSAAKGMIGQSAQLDTDQSGAERGQIVTLQTSNEEAGRALIGGQHHKQGYGLEELVIGVSRRGTDTRGLGLGDVDDHLSPGGVRGYPQVPHGHGRCGGFGCGFRRGGWGYGCGGGGDGGGRGGRGGGRFRVWGLRRRRL